MGTAMTGSGLFADALDLYRFSGNLNDSGSNGLNGSVLNGSAVYSSNAAPTPYANTQSLDLSGSNSNDAFQFSSAFPFDTAGNATLEFYLNPSVAGTGDIFWTTSSNQDANRFNIFTLSNGQGGNTLNVDYRDSGGGLHPLLNTEVGGVLVDYAIPVNEWTFVALVRSGQTYCVYFNSNNSATACATDGTGPNPAENLPTSVGWTINGRLQQFAGAQFNGLLDEVRISNSALAPSQFENTATETPEPGTMLLVLSALGGIVALKRRRGNRE